MAAIDINQQLVQPISSGSGVYFDYLGNLRIRNNHLNVILPIDISHIKPHLENINSALGTLRYLCQQSRVYKEPECHNALEPLTVQYHDILAQLESISHLIDNRLRRGAWIGGLGTVVKTIIGNLDENDGIKFDEAITSIQNNQNKLASYMKDNILITKSVISNYNKTLHKIQLNEATLLEAIDKLSINFNNLSSTTNELQLQSEFNFILNNLETTILTLSFQLEDIVSAITLCSQNILHPAVITPAHLHRELADNYRHLPSSLELPISLDLNNIHVILRLSRIICYFSNNKIIFVLQIPLVSIKQFVLYHNLGLPTPYNVNEPSKFSLIIPGTKYIAMTKDKSQYCNLNDLGVCDLVIPGNYICDVTNVFTSDVKPSCESELLTKVKSGIPEQCETKFIFGHLDIWNYLSNNKWIFVQTEPTKLSIDCVNSNLVEINVLGVGIVTIPRHCKGYCKTTTLIPKLSDVLNITSPIQMFNFNLINDSCCSIDKFTKVMNNVSPTRLQNIDLDNMNLENDRLSKVLHNIDKLTEEPHIIRYGTHYSILTICIIIIVLGYLAFKIFRYYFKSCKLGSRPLKTYDFEVNTVEASRPQPQPQSAAAAAVEEEIPLPSIRIMK